VGAFNLLSYNMIQEGKTIVIQGWDGGNAVLDELHAQLTSWEVIGNGGNVRSES
jgi:hypothetical protein